MFEELKPIQLYYGDLDDLEDINSLCAIFCYRSDNRYHFSQKNESPPRESTGPAVTTSMKQRIANPTIPTVVTDDKKGTLKAQDPRFLQRRDF